MDMQHNRNRWAILTVVTRENLNELHREEARLKAQGKLYETAWPRFLAHAKQKYALTPFWPTMMPPSMQAERMEAFERRVYPIWKPIYDKWTATWNDLHSDSEMSVLHRMDVEIFESGEKVDRSWEDPKVAGRASRINAQYQSALED